MEVSENKNTYQFYDRLVVVVIASYALAIVLIGGATTWYMLNDKEERINSAIETTNTLVRALDEHVRRSISAFDVLARDTAYDIVSRGGLQNIPDEELHQKLKTKLPHVPQTRHLFVYGPDLYLYAGSGLFPSPRVDGSNSPHVKYHVDNITDSLHIAKSLISPVTKTWSIPMTRRVTGPDGQLLAVVGAIIDENHFFKFYESLGLPEGQGLALIRTNGILILRFPKIEALKSGKDLSKLSPIFTQGGPLRDVQTVRFTSQLDGKERIITYRQLQELGLLVSISQDVNILLKPWRQNMTTIAIGVGIAIIALTGLLWIALRQIRRREADEKRHNETLEKRVQERTIELKAANEELEAFSYTVSHDLRAPLRAVGGYMTILREDYANVLPSDAVDLFSRSEAAARRMGHLIEDLLGLSRISKQHISKSEDNLSKLATKITEDLAEAHPDRDIEVRITPDMHSHVDAALIRIGLQNLLSNAWKYTSKAPHAIIEFGEDMIEGERVFYVRDNGAGFDMQYAGKLFRPFQRLHRQQDFEGSGIGLATVARIVQRHGGRIWVESAPDQGSTFFFTLPGEPG